MSSIIKGRFIYHAYYKSISELKSDKSLEEGYFVSVISGSKKTDYKIVSNIEEKGSVYESLDNGLYALSVIITNETVVDLNKPYKTEGPIEKTVGYLTKGGEFSFKDTNDLFDSMFYSSWCGMEISSNIEGIKIRGEANVLNRIIINITRSIERISSVKIKIGEEVKNIEEYWTIGEHVVLVDVIIRNTENIEVTVYSESGKTYSKTLTIYTDYPVYYSSIGSGEEPSPVYIKQMSRSFAKEIEYISNYNNTRMFLSVPYNKTLKSLKDENGLELAYDTNSYNVNIMQGTDNVSYRCYYLRDPILVNNFKYTIEVE